MTSTVRQNRYFGFNVPQKSPDAMVMSLPRKVAVQGSDTFIVLEPNISETRHKDFTEKRLKNKDAKSKHKPSRPRAVLTFKPIGLQLRIHIPIQIIIQNYC